MADATDGRDLRTTRSQVFGDVDRGTVCRVCGRNVTDGRSKTCSDYCGNLLEAVMAMLNWTSVRRQVIKRDDETCQHCGFDLGRERRARAHIRDIIDERAGDPPDHPTLTDHDAMDDFDWDEYRERRKEWNERRKQLRERYGSPNEYANTLEVDHITPLSEGGHPFDPANLQTLCSDCHGEKTAREAAERADRRTPSRGDLSESLFEYVSADGGRQEGDE